MDNQMSRRQFLLMPLLLLPDGISEEKMMEKVQQSKRLSLEHLLKIETLPSLKDSDFSLHYELFENVSDIVLGSASINFNREKRVLDFGIDEFSFFVNFYLQLKSIVSNKYDKLFDLRRVRFFTEFNEKMEWAKYSENIPVKDSTSLDPHIYELMGDKVILDEKKFFSREKTSHNPLSVIFGVLNGNLISDFEMVTSKGALRTKVDYKELNGFVIAESNFSSSFAGTFKKVYGILYHNIPVSGYLMQAKKDGEDGDYIRGELTSIKINGREIFRL